MNRLDRGPAVLAVLVVIAVTLSHYPTWAAFTQDAGPGAVESKETKEIRITAKKYEFDPEVITVKQDEHVKLVITALDHDHGFKIDAFHIDQLLKKGELNDHRVHRRHDWNVPISMLTFLRAGAQRNEG